jgi:putative nucleotidyltransferase with HDIG domain
LRKYLKQVHSVSTEPIALYTTGLAALAVLLFAFLVGHGYKFGPIWALLPIALVGAVAERGRIRFTKNIELSISLLPTLFVAVVFGPLAAMIVAAVSMLGDFRKPYMRWATYTFSESITAAAAGLAIVASADAVGSRVGSIIFSALVGALAAQSLDVLFACVTLRLRGGSARSVVTLLGPAVVASIPLYTPVVTVLALAYQTLSPWTILLFLIPAFAAQRLFLLYQRQRRLTDSLAIANAKLERANVSFAAALIATLDARDRYTAGHSAAVAIYARDIASRMGLSAMQQDVAHLCGLVHDIGKIGLPPGLLEKTGPLTLEERRHMEEHSAIGERILANVPNYSEVARVVRHHHERVDGHGYPDGLVGDDIPLLARIIAVADAYNAMTSDRPYRDAMPSRIARLRLAQAVESQFDTSVVAAFEAILAGATEAYRGGLEAAFCVETGEVAGDGSSLAVTRREVVSGAAA